MVRPKLWSIIGLVVLLTSGAAPQSLVTLDTAGGDAWTFAKHVAGTVARGQCDAVRLSTGSRAVVVRPAAARFDAELTLESGRNEIQAQCLYRGAARGTPARQVWLVRLQDGPEAAIEVSVSQGMIRLDASHSLSGRGWPAPILDYAWRAREENGVKMSGLPTHGRQITLPTPEKDGDYEITLRVTDARGRIDESTTMLRVRRGVAAPVDVLRDHAAWIDQAVVYGVAPKLFGPRGFKDITAALPRLASVGINTLWLSPITAASPDDFGYAVADEFRIDPKWGDAADLHQLIAAAHARHMRVILDLVANHLSDHSAYFQDALRLRKKSAYFDYFARDAEGEGTFYFDWHNLENLNYDNPEVRRMIIQASARWVRDFDVDGFRVDAAWGPRRRDPDFWPQWARALKRIKPDILLLAEADANDPYFFASGFAAAYDWTDKLGEWAWREPFDDAAHTAWDLRALVEGQADHHLRFRFLDNNDTGARFITRYGLERTKVAAAMLLTLPGLPELFAGDEVGAAFEPYRQRRAIDWHDRLGLRAWYQQLISLREQYPSLRSSDVQIVNVADADQALAYLRRAPDGCEAVLVLLNYGSAPIRVSLTPRVRRELGSGSLVDLLGGQVLTMSGATPAIAVAGYGVRILAASPAD